NNEQGRRFMIVYLYEYSLSSHGQDLLLKRNVVCQIFWELRSPVQSIAYRCISRCSTNSSLPFALIAHRVRLYSVVYHTQPVSRHQYPAPSNVFHSFLPYGSKVQRSQQLTHKSPE